MASFLRCELRSLRDLQNSLSIPREDVIWQRHQRVALAARWKRGEAALGAIRVLDRTIVRETGRAMLAQQCHNIAPLLGRNRPVLHDLSLIHI